MGVGIIQGWRPKDVTQYQITATEILGKQFGADNLTAVAEVGATKIHNLEDKSVLRYEAQERPMAKVLEIPFLGVTGSLLQQIILIIGMKFLCIPQSHLTMM